MWTAFLSAATLRTDLIGVQHMLHAQPTFAVELMTLEGIQTRRRRKTFIKNSVYEDDVRLNADRFPLVLVHIHV